MENGNIKIDLETIIIGLLVIIIAILLYRKYNNNENFYSKNLSDHKVKIKCGEEGELGLRVFGEESLDSESQSESSSVSKSSESVKKSDESVLVSNVILPEKDLCIVDKMDNKIYKFATQEKCDCNRGNGCSVCELKHSNDYEVTRKICKERKKNFSCLVDKMESDNVDYMKGLMLGTNIY
jgi:hypothetical protein